jgi:hypothetical protein
VTTTGPSDVPEDHPAVLALLIDPVFRAWVANAPTFQRTLVARTFVATVLAAEAAHAEQQAAQLATCQCGDSAWVVDSAGTRIVCASCGRPCEATL